jgi:hypothetical protein
VYNFLGREHRNYSSSDFDNLLDHQTVLGHTISDIAQVLPDINHWPDAVMYLLEALEF